VGERKNLVTCRIEEKVSERKKEREREKKKERERERERERCRIEEIERERKRIDNTRAHRGGRTCDMSSPKTHPSPTQHARNPRCVGTASKRYTGAVGAMDGGKRTDK
jgi:hypothetical protein